MAALQLRHRHRILHNPSLLQFFSSSTTSDSSDSDLPPSFSSISKILRSHTHNPVGEYRYSLSRIKEDLKETSNRDEIDRETNLRPSWFGKEVKEIESRKKTWSLKAELDKPKAPKASKGKSAKKKVKNNALAPPEHNDSLQEGDSIDADDLAQAKKDIAALTKEVADLNKALKRTKKQLSSANEEIAALKAIRAYYFQLVEKYKPPVSPKAARQAELAAEREQEAYLARLDREQAMLDGYN